ncbi:MAG TPA: glutamyl-tRNA reductase [Bacteroidota bacterium]|nr:glutamyl-tRNA reductase [Bacteroidota bacterium]
MMNLIAVGINHRTAPLEVREKLWMSDEEIRKAVAELREKFFAECFIVSTCNRTELYGLYREKRDAEIHTPADIDALKDFLVDAKGAGGTVTREHLYSMASTNAVNHLFKVASGIDSMVIGDVQILSQIKDGFNIASEQKAAGPFLHRLLQSTYHVGKRTRSETTIAEGAVSVSYAAVELANKIFSDLTKKSALLIGAGETGELTAKHLVGRGIGELLVANRTKGKAEALVASLGGKAVDFEALLPTLARVDIVVSSVTVDGYLLTKGEIGKAIKERSHKPLFLIDLGVPRNIDPEVNKIENVFLYDLDGIARIIDQNLQKRKSEIPRVSQIILEELTEFSNWHSSLQVSPTIHDLRAHFEQVRQEEVEKNINRFSGEDRELLELVTKRIINKLLHLPTTNLKNGSDESEEEKHRKLHIVRSLFGLQKSKGGPA